MVEDKKYMVSEDELVKLASKVRHKSFNHIFEIYQFLNSKTPIEPSDDAKQFGKKLENALIKTQMHGWEQGKKQVKTPYDFTLADETYIENIWKGLMAKLPQPKQFNEAEIREILYHYKVGNIDAELAVTKFSTLTPKYNSTDRNSIRLNSPEVVKKRRELNLLRDRLATKDNIKELYDE